MKFKLNILLILVLCLLFCGCSIEFVPPTTPPSTAATISAEETIRENLTVHFLDVGQADCALIECGGAFALIDGGNTQDGPEVVEYLKNLGVRQLQLVVGSHPHEDHIGGLPHILEAFPAENVWSSEIPARNSVIDSFLDTAAAQDMVIQYPQPGHTLTLGDALITVLGPVRTDYADVNNLSLVLMVQYGSTRFLFTGDMERDAEIDLIESGADVKADVLKVGHHGSYTSTSYRFLREVAPGSAVISVGADNDYGHPHDDPLSRLRDAEVTIYRTDIMYDIAAVSDGKTIRFSWSNHDALPETPEK